MAARVTDIFGIDVFNENIMRERLPKETFRALMKTIESGEELDANIANVVANAMKDWAIERGATHYSHWFQPMTGITAEKHDSFISPIPGGRISMDFSGKELIKGEPDASSFPSGGLRATFEARGYTAWDCTSPAFLREDAAGVTLCIPTAFCSYTGEALDQKTPLLRSMEVISTQTMRLLKLFGHADVKSVSCSVGAEQEYFLIDRNDYLKREDLVFSGRTLFGALPPKGQEMDDHYFGSIRERIASFMKELNEELWKLGVPAKTQHNEAAPAQHELAPVYATANIACDHNQLVMECMKKIALRHGLACLLHEKPFAGVNGSGKHNNWSLITDTGKNLLSPGKTPHENIQFLLILSAVLKAVDKHAELLRLSASNPGNDYRLGGNEAPPTVISVFLGSQLTDVVTQLVETGEATRSIQGGWISTGVHTLPEVKKDATDRNRTSPFAFTGNKFEFRMVGSSMSVAGPNTILNTIVADVFSEMADELEKADNFELAVNNLIKRTFTEHQRIIFNGNGYSSDWIVEAENRGLPNIASFVEGIPYMTAPETINVFGKYKVLSEAELYSREEIYYESYAKTINVEAKTMIDMVSKQYVPAVIRFIKSIADSISSVKASCIDVDISVQTELLSDASILLAKSKISLDALKDMNRQAALKSQGKMMAVYYYNEVVPVMNELRKCIDSLEMIVDKDMWPVPGYSDLLFEI